MHATNTLPARDMSKSLTGCCPPFEPSEWDGQTFVFEQKPFMKFSTRSLFHIPLNMNGAMAKVDEAGAGTSEYLMLSEEVSPWKATHYLAVTKEIPDIEITLMSGKYLAKVFEGPFKNMRTWHTELINYAKSKSMKPVKTYFNYTVCPACAKAYGKNYVVGFEQVE